MTNKQSLKWRVDVNAFKLWGEDLITDRITALFELVKNSYDANAEKIEIEFYNTNIKSPDTSITIKDNGFGMTLSDIQDKWMVIGTKNKRVNIQTAPPYNRRVVGEKGIGRFAVNKLGNHLLLKTKKKGDNHWLCVNINWQQYEDLAKQGQNSLFTDVENNYYYENSSNSNQQGTYLIITKLKDAWDENDIERAYQECSKIISPLESPMPPFNIFITSNEFPQSFKDKEVTVDLKEYASHTFSLKGTPNIQEILIFDKEKGVFKKETRKPFSFGPINYHLHYFDEKAKRRFNSAFLDKKNKDAESRINGIKIYRDGIIATPFAELHQDRNKQRDILGIDKRLWQSIFDKVSTREIIGTIEITKQYNPKITDATNRQDFIDNIAYRDLKEFIVDTLKQIENYKIYARKERSSKAEQDLKKADNDIKNVIKDFKQVSKKIIKNNPLLKDSLGELEKKLVVTQKAVVQGVKEHKQAKQEFERERNLYLSLMSLKDYSLHLSHAVKTSLGNIKNMAEFFKEEYPNPKYDEYFNLYSIEIYSELERLRKVVKFMLSYAASTIKDIEDFKVGTLIEDKFNSEFRHIFQVESIQPVINFKDDITLNGNKQFFADIISNLISNSIKALKNTKEKIIKCSSHIEKDTCILLFSDNGYGIPTKNKKKIFELYFTTTAKQGGAGLGLYIVQMRLEALKGKIELVDSEFNPKGATFKITLPLKKK